MKRKVVLFIDSTNNLETRVSLQIGKKTSTVIEKSGDYKSQTLLSLIEKALIKEGLKLADLTAIEINPGPGSFTGVRVGVAVANTLGWALKIPVNGKKIALPKYESSKFDDS